MLDLKRLYWNTRAFRGGKRKGRCPYEHLGLALPRYNFWGLLQDELTTAPDQAPAEAPAMAAGATEPGRAPTTGQANRDPLTLRSTRSLRWSGSPCAPGCRVDGKLPRQPSRRSVKLEFCGLGRSPISDRPNDLKRSSPSGCGFSVQMSICERWKKTTKAKIETAPEHFSFGVVRMTGQKYHLLLSR
jgi:hypothetical protein